MGIIGSFNKKSSIYYMTTCLLLSKMFMFGGGAKYITKKQFRHSTVIITDFNTQRKFVIDASQIQIG